MYQLPNACTHTHIHTHTHTHPPSHYQDELAPNVMAMVQSFNRLALLVPTEILEETTPQARSKVITSFIQVRKFRFHSQFTVFYSHASIMLVLIPIPEKEIKFDWSFWFYSDNAIGLKFTYNGRQVTSGQKWCNVFCTPAAIHLQWSTSKHFADFIAEVYTFTGACLTLWWYATTTTHSNLVQ